METLSRHSALALVLLALATALACSSVGAVSKRKPSQPSAPAAGLAPDHEAWSRHLDDARRAANSGDPEEAQAAALRVFAESLRFSETDRRLKETGKVLEQVIDALVAIGGPEGPLPLLRAMASRAAELGVPHHRMALFARTGLVHFLTVSGRLGEAEAAAAALHREAVEAFGPDSSQAFGSLGVLAWVVTARDNERGLEFLEASIEPARRALGPTAPEVVALLRGLGRCQLEEGRLADAESSWMAALEGAKAAGSLTLPVGQIECELARLALARDDLGAAEAHYDRCRGIHEANFGEKNTAIVPVLLALSSIQRARGEMAAAFRNAERARGVAQANAGANDTRVAGALVMLARILIDTGQEAEAADLVDRAEQILAQHPRPDADMLTLLANVEKLLGRFDRAIEHSERALEMVEERREKRSLAVAGALNNLALALAEDGQGGRALPLAHRAREILAERLGTENSHYAGALDTLGVALVASGEPVEGLQQIDEAIALLRRLHGDRSPDLLEMETHRAAALRALGRIEDSEQLSQTIALDRRQRMAQLGEVSEPRAPLLSTEGNFRLALPGPPWVVLPPEATRVKEAEVVLVRRNPAVWFSVFTSTPGEAAADFDEWLEINEKNLRSNNRRVDIVSKEAVTISGIPGRRVRTSVEGSDGTWNYDHWYGIHNGFYYIIRGAAAARETPPEALWENTEELRAGFELIDPARRALGREPVRVLRSERFGYSVDLAGVPWVREPGKNDVEHAEFGASREGASIVTMPVSLLSLEIDDETLARALIASIAFEEPQSFDRVDEPGLEGVAFRFERERDYGTQQYRVRILRRGDVACLVSAAGRAGLPHLEDALAVVERFRWEGEPAVSEPSDLEEEEIARHRLVFDHVAGRYVAAQQHTRAIEVMKLRLELSPDDAGFREQLARYELAVGRYRDALQTIEPVIAESPERPAAWVIQAQAKQRLEGAEPAIPSYRRAFELGYEDDAALDGFVDALWEASREDEAFERLDASIARTGSRALRVKRASLHRRSGRLDEATAELEELDAAAPGDLSALVELALVHFESERYRQTIEACDRLLERLPHSWEAHYLKAQAQIGAGLVADAKATLDLAAELRPESVEVAELEALVTAMLGRGSTEGAREPIPAVSTPPGLLGKLPENPPEGAEAFGAYYDFWVEAVQFRRAASLRRTTHFRATILDARGLEQFTSFRFEFHPLGERIFVNDVTVRDAAGEVVVEGEPAEHYVTDAAATPRAGSVKVLNVPIPGLSIGGSVELTLTREEIRPPERFTYSDFILTRAIPAHRFLVYVEGSTEDLAAHATGAIRRKAGDDWVAWVAENPPPYRWEPLESPGLEHLPRIRIGQARESWEDLAREYLIDIEDRLSPAEPISELTAEAGGGTSESQERVRSLAEFVQTTLRYEPILFGPRARIPKTVEQILRDRYGDCKDHSLLLFQLLRQAGQEVHLALVNASAAIDPEIPSLDQFDHMLVHCGDCPGVAFLDATDKYVALGTSPPRGLGGRLALILDSEDPRLERVRNADPEEFAIRIDRRARLSDDWALGVREEVVLEGHLAASMRAALRSVDRLSWEEILKREILGDRKKVAVSSIDVEDVDRVNAALRLSMEYAVENAFTPTAHGVLGSLPASWTRAFLSVDRVDTRASPFEIREPLQISETVRLSVPSGYAARIADSGDRKSASPFLEWRAHAETVPDGLVMRFAASRSRGTFPAEQYRAYFDDVMQAVEFLDQPIEIRSAMSE